MPLSSEAVQNRPLSGVELKEVVLRSLEQVLEQDGLFSPNIAFGRMAWTVTVDLHLDNPMYPEHRAFARSIQKMPLKNPTEEEVVISFTADDKFTSPNTIRVQSGMPIPLQVVQNQEIVNREIRYAKDQVDPKPPAIVADNSAVLAKKLGRPHKTWEGKDGKIFTLTDNGVVETNPSTVGGSQPTDTAAPGIRTAPVGTGISAVAGVPESAFPGKVK